MIKAKFTKYLCQANVGCFINHVSEASSKSKPLPFSQMPSSSKWSVDGARNFIHLIKAGQSKQFHKYTEEMSIKYGSIYRTTISPGVTMVNISDPVDIEHLFRNEGRYPLRTNLDPWIEYRKQNGRDLGILLGCGEDWQRARSVLNPHMMRPSTVASHTECLNEVADDMLHRLNDQLDHNNLLCDIKTLLYKWALESACLVLFEKRIGCLEEIPQPGSLKFFDAIRGIQLSTIELMFLPLPLVKYLNLKIWRDHVKYWDTLFEMSDLYCLSVIDKVRKSLDSGEDVSGFIASMLKSQKLSMSEIQSNLTDFLTAAIDTTSSSMGWALYLLGENPDKQQKAYEEVQAVLPSDGRITAHHVTQLRYLKAVVKETLRLRPVVYTMSRILSDEITLGGYKIPPKVIVNINFIAHRHNPDVFERPTEFLPERWMKSEKDFNPFTSLPFGFGPRACIGRRLAELEMYILLSRILSEFNVRSASERMEEKSHFLMVPAKNVDLYFDKR